VAARKTHIFFLTAQLCGPKSNPDKIITRKNLFIAIHSTAEVQTFLKNLETNSRRQKSEINSILRAH